mmetsp:Transcript_61860/g.165729  ORF Transcript_61860/g.165729 Transcript_61860/m.165729 type:complete len:925 (+) Transcript_61860:103-2877(+)
MHVSRDREKEYEVVKPIGNGSFGQVFLVTNTREKKLYVMKKIHLSNMEQKEKESTELEVRLLQNLNHPSIVAYKDSFIDKSGSLKIVMEYCEHGDLYTHLKQNRSRPPPEAKAVDWFLQVVLALATLHARKVLHRDLKTQNIFLSGGTGHAGPQSFNVKLGDFGIAKVLDSTQDLAMTQIGTPFYMSPELFKNKPYSYKSDIWGLGCVLYELVNGKHAFDAQSLNGLAFKILKGKFSPITSTASKEIKDLITATLSTNPTRRPTLKEILHIPFLRKRLPATIQSVLSGAGESEPQARRCLMEQLVSLGLGGVMDPRHQASLDVEESKKRRDKLDRVEMKRKKQVDELSRLEQEQDELRRQYNMPGSTRRRRKTDVPTPRAAPAADQSDPLLPVSEPSEPGHLGQAEVEASPVHKSLQPTLVAVAPGHLVASPALPARDGMNQKDKVLAKKRRDKEQQRLRFEEEASKIREENVAVKQRVAASHGSWYASSEAMADALSWEASQKSPRARGDASGDFARDGEASGENEMWSPSSQNRESLECRPHARSDIGRPLETPATQGERPRLNSFSPWRSDERFHPWSSSVNSTARSARADDEASQRGSGARTRGKIHSPSVGYLLDYGHSSANLANPFAQFRPKVVHTPPGGDSKQPRAPREPLPGQGRVAPPSGIPAANTSFRDRPELRYPTNPNTVTLQALPPSKSRQPTLEAVAFEPAPRFEGDYFPVAHGGGFEDDTDVGSSASNGSEALSDVTISDEDQDDSGMPLHVRREYYANQKRIRDMKGAIYKQNAVIITIKEELGEPVDDPAVLTSIFTHRASETRRDIRKPKRSVPSWSELDDKPSQEFGPAFAPIVKDRVALLHERCVEGIGAESCRKCLALVRAARSEDLPQATLRQQCLDILGENLVGFYALLDQMVYLESRLAA